MSLHSLTLASAGSEHRAEHQQPDDGHELATHDDAVHVYGGSPADLALADDERAGRPGREPEAAPRSALLLCRSSPPPPPPLTLAAGMTMESPCWMASANTRLALMSPQVLSSSSLTSMASTSRGIAPQRYALLPRRKRSERAGHSTRACSGAASEHSAAARGLCSTHKGLPLHCHSHSLLRPGASLRSAPWQS